MSSESYVFCIPGRFVWSLAHIGSSLPCTSHHSWCILILGTQHKRKTISLSSHHFHIHEVDQHCLCFSSNQTKSNGGFSSEVVTQQQTPLSCHRHVVAGKSGDDPRSTTRKERPTVRQSQVEAGNACAQKSMTSSTGAVSNTIIFLQVNMRCVWPFGYAGQVSANLVMAEP